MIKEKTGKLINDRTQTFGLNFIDLIVLSITWLISSLFIFDKKSLLSIGLTGSIYLVLVVIRTTKRPGWISEVIGYYFLKEFSGGCFSERIIYRGKSTPKQ